MQKNQTRIEREKKTVSAMMRLYCQKKHGKKSRLCEQCRNLLAYSTGRLSKCPYGERKPTCAKCKIHCYKDYERQEIKKIMKFSGPRMIMYHPILALYHLADSCRKKH